MTPTEPSIPTDQRPELLRAYDLAASVVAGVRGDQLGDPTPCPAFDVATLVDHTVFAANRAAALGRGEAPAFEAGGPPHVEIGDAPAAIRDAGDEAARAWTDESLAREVTMPWGESYTGSGLVDMYLTELATHSWDLAQATGRLDALDDGLAAPALAAARRIIRPDYRRDDGSVFGPEVEAPPGATTWERLAAFMGRDPR